MNTLLELISVSTPIVITTVIAVGTVACFFIACASSTDNDDHNLDY